ncbi:MAG: tRNA (adenosine(37)-N6)-threonylcarbamoyltransferase complex dimerization subunit type 1 TsaB [Oscillospiraceae bacterium]
MVLGIESSAITASCAVCEDGKIIAEQFLNTAHTHSETLLPMVRDMLRGAGLALSDMESVAVTAGPGSFTGLRIGISCVKGMCSGVGIPCVSVSTLEAIAQNFRGFDGIICACMDARRKQVYNALFKSENGVITRICEDRAISVEELFAEVSRPEFSNGGKIYIAGDGAELAFTEFATLNGGKEFGELAPLALRYQRGSGVCFAAEGKPRISPEELMPGYLRIPQAERERNQKNSETT